MSTGARRGAARAYFCASPFSFDVRQLGALQRAIVILTACALTSGFVVALLHSLISCREHGAYDPDVCVVPISLLFLGKNQHALPSERLNATAAPTTRQRAQTAAPSNPFITAPPSPSSSSSMTIASLTLTASSSSLVAPTGVLVTATPPPPPAAGADDLPVQVERVAATYGGFTTPFFLLAALCVGSAFLCVLSAIALLVYVLTGARRRLPKITGLLTHVVALVVSSLLRLFALTIVAQLSLLVPDMHVSRVAATPYTYALVGFPLACISFRGLIQLVQEWNFNRLYPNAARRRRASARVREVEAARAPSGGLQVSMDADGNIVGSTQSEDDVTLEVNTASSRASVAYRICKWCVVAVLGALMLVVVRSVDEFLLFENALPYAFGALLNVVAGAIWAFADALLEMVCEVTASQSKNKRKRFGALCVAATLQSGIFALCALLFLLALYMPQIRVHGLAYTPDVIGQQDRAYLHGIAGTMIVAALWAGVSFSQMIVYKYVHGVAWVFVLNVALWALVLAGQRSLLPPLTLGITIVASLCLWVVLNQLHTLMSGALTISKHRPHASAFDRLNYGDGDDQSDGSAAEAEFDRFDDDDGDDTIHDVDETAADDDDDEILGGAAASPSPSSRRSKRGTSVDHIVRAAVVRPDDDRSGDETSDVSGDDSSVVNRNFAQGRHR